MTVASPGPAGNVVASAFGGASPTSVVDSEEQSRPSARWVPFPVHELPGPLARYVADTARARQCDPAAVALPLLAALAGTIGNTRMVRMTPAWLAPSVLWAAVVAPSGAVKSPGFHAALFPIEQIDRAEREAWQERKATFDGLQLEYEADLSGWKKKGKSNRGELPEAPAEPKLPRIIAEDVTLQALASLLDENPRGVLLARDELSGWVRSFDQFTAGSGADLARWLEIYRAGPLRVDRKGDGHVFVPGAAVSVAGTIQTAILPEVFGGKEQAAGLLARFLLASPPEPARNWSAMRTARRPDVDAIVAIFESLRALDLPEDGEPPRALDLDDEAVNAYGKWFKLHERRRHETEAGPWRSALSKLEELPGRLGLVLSLAQAQVPETIEEISGDAMHRALALTDWFRDEGERVYSLMSETPDERVDRELVEWVGDHTDATAREVAQALHRYKGTGATSRANADLLRMVADGRLERQERRGQRGPATVAYRPVDPTPTPTGFQDSQREEGKPVCVGASASWETEL